MKIKLDENMPQALESLLTSLGHDVDTVLQEGLAGYDDVAVWSAAQAEQRFLITQDLDFGDARRFQPGTHAGILLVRLHTPGRLALMAKVRQLFAHESVATWHGCLVIATERKLRIRRPAE